MGLYVNGVPGGSDGKEFTCNAGDPCSIPGLERVRHDRVMKDSPMHTI